MADFAFIHRSDIRLFLVHSIAMFVWPALIFSVLIVLSLVSDAVDAMVAAGTSYA